MPINIFSLRQTLGEKLRNLTRQDVEEWMVKDRQRIGNTIPTKRTRVFERLDNVLGNHAEGKATDEDVVRVAYEVNQYLLEYPHPDDCYETH